MFIPCLLFFSAPTAHFNLALPLNKDCFCSDFGNGVLDLALLAVGAFQVPAFLVPSIAIVLLW